MALSSSPSPLPSPSLSLSPAPSPMLRGQYTRKMDKSTTTTREIKPRTLQYHAATLNVLEGYSPPPAQEPQPVSQFDFDSTEEEEETDNESTKRTSTRPIATLRLGRLRRENLYVLHQRVESPASSTRASSAMAGTRDVSQYDRSRPGSRVISSSSPLNLRHTASMFTFGRQSEALMAAEDLGTGPIYAVEPDIYPTHPTHAVQYQHPYANGLALGSPSAPTEAGYTTKPLKRSATEATKQRRRELQKKSDLALAAWNQPRGLEALHESTLPPSQDLDRDGISFLSPPSFEFASNRLSMPVTEQERAGVRSRPSRFTAISDTAERDSDPYQRETERRDPPIDTAFASTGPSISIENRGAGPRGAEMESRAEEAIAARKRFGSVDHSGWDAALAALSLSPSSTPGEEYGNTRSSNLDVDAALAQGEAWSPNYEPEEELQQSPTPPTIPRRSERRNTALTLSLGGDTDSDLDQDASQDWPTTAFQHSTKDDHDLTEPVDLVPTSRRHTFDSMRLLRHHQEDDDDQRSSSRPQRVADFASTDAAAAEALMHRQTATGGRGSGPLCASPSALAQNNVSQVSNDNDNLLPNLSHSYPALEAQLTPRPRSHPAAEDSSMVPTSQPSPLTSSYPQQPGGGPDIQAWRDSLVPAAAASTTTAAVPDASSSRSSHAMARSGTMAQQQQPQIGVRSAPFSSSSSNDSDAEIRREERPRGGTPQRLKRITMRILGRDMSGTDTAVSNKNNKDKNNKTNNSQDYDNLSASPKRHSNRNSSYQNDSGYGGSVTTTTTEARDNRNHSTGTAAVQIKFRDCASPPGERPSQPRSRRPSAYPNAKSSSFSSGGDGGGGHKGVEDVGDGGVSRMRRIRVRLSRMFH